MSCALRQPHRTTSNSTMAPTSPPISLSAETLNSIPSSIAKPSYSKQDVTSGILHFGLGNFHRSHQAYYQHLLFSSRKSLDWGIVGAGVRPRDEQALYDALQRQDFLYTLVEQSAKEAKATVIASIVDYVPPGDVLQILAMLVKPEIRIVSLTVTEGGYFVDEHGDFDQKNPIILMDSHSTVPSTVFGLIVAALRQRKIDGVSPFTVLCCDNVQHNGRVARNAIVGFAQLVDEELGAWIDANVDFPNSMVDRITPVTTERERQVMCKEWGVKDECPVFCEDFVQWVVEDKFRNGRPSWEDVGVRFVDDVSPFETMKIRILNGGHATIAYAAGLLDVEYAYEAMEDELIRAFLHKVETDEIIPAVPSVPDVSLDDYFASVSERFANPNIRDTVRRLCLDGSNRQPKFIVPTIRARLKTEGTVSGLALVSALWCRYCYGVSESGKEIEPNDPNWTELKEVAHKAKEKPEEWLRQESIYGRLEAGCFEGEFTEWLGLIWERGVRVALERYVNGYS